MAARQRDVKVRILSEYYDQGSKAAERAMRRNASLQMAAAAEDVAREQAKAAAIESANRRQAAAMDHVGRRALALSAAVAIGLGLTVKAAMDWESAFAGVRKVVDGSPEEISALEAELRGLAQVLPATHTEIAGVAEAAGQLGVARGDIAEFTRTAINMGETTNMAADEAATSMAQLSNIMGEGADQASRMGSAIVALGNDGASTERDIISMALRIAGAGRTVGMTTDQVLGISSALASVGMEVEAGGTAMSRVILQIDRDVANGTDTLATYAQVSGMTAEQFTTAWGQDATGALTSFVTGLGRVQAQGGNTTKILDTLGYSEVRVSDALRRAALAGELFTDAIETSSTAWRENNALAEEAARRYETAEARMEVARNRINDTAIDIGANFLPVVADAADWVANLAEGFQAMPEPLQEWTVKLGAAAGGLLGVVGGAAVVIPKLNELKTTVDALHGGSSRLGSAIGGVTSFLTGPWGLAVAGAVIAGGAWMAQQGEIRRNVKELTATLDEQTGAITENTRAKTVDRLQDRGLLEAASTLGLELDRVTDAALGSTSAMYYVEEAVRAAYAANDEAARNEQLTDALVGQANAADKLSRGILGQRAETEAARHEWDLTAAAMGRAEEATGATEGATARLTAELDAQQQLADEAAKAIDELAGALDDLNGPTLTAREAEREWVEQLQAVTAQIKENGATLDINTEAGRENQRALDGLARTAAERANAVVQETGSLEDFNAVMEAQRTALFNTAKQYGATDAEARAYVDSVLAIPDTATTQAILDTAAAEAKLSWFKRTLASNNVVITAALRTQSDYYADRGAGSIDFMGAGGIIPMSNALATMVPPGVKRVVGDRNDVPELFAPLDGSRRSRDLWETAGRMMGWGPTQAPTVVVQGGGGATAAELAAALSGIALTLITEAGPIRAIARAEVTNAQASRTSTLRQGVR